MSLSAVSDHKVKLACDHSPSHETQWRASGDGFELDTRKDGSYDLKFFFA